MSGSLTEELKKNSLFWTVCLIVKQGIVLSSSKIKQEDIVKIIWFPLIL
jgi:hypothetical protein